MSEDYSPSDPMSTDNPPGNPMGPVGPSGPSNPTGQGPVFQEETNYTRIYQIALGILVLLLLILIIVIFVYKGKANEIKNNLNNLVTEAVSKNDKERKDTCDLEKKDIKENPWTEYKARDEFGAFKFVIPRSWSQYEYFDINANDPYSLYFNPDTVRYDSGIKENHAALEVMISKKLYIDQVKEIEQKIKMQMALGSTEEKINISNFTGTKFIYKDKYTEKKVGIIVLPYRDRALFVKTDDYDKWNEKYYTKFYKSFALTP